MKLWLDDERVAPEGWVWVKTTGEAFHYLRTGGVKEISLDHDLGSEHLFGTGYDILTYIEEKVYTDDQYNPPRISIHTANPAARRRMIAAVESIEKKANE
jgi:hypothetical protein